VLLVLGNVLVRARTLALVVGDLWKELNSGRFLCTGRGMVFLSLMVMMMMNGEMVSLVRMYRYKEFSLRENTSERDADRRFVIESVRIGNH
jgi:hypothetical protein